MESLILWSLAIVMMFTGTHSISTSQSCSSVNGKMICTSQQSDGNIAGASSGAFTNGQGSYQQASALTANSNTGQSSSSQDSAGNIPPPPMGGNPFQMVGLPNPFDMLGGAGAGAGAFAFGRR